MNLRDIVKKQQEQGGVDLMAQNTAQQQPSEEADAPIGIPKPPKGGHLKHYESLTGQARGLYYRFFGALIEFERHDADQKIQQKAEVAAAKEDARARAGLPLPSQSPLPHMDRLAEIERVHGTFAGAIYRKGHAFELRLEEQRLADAKAAVEADK